MLAVEFALPFADPILIFGLAMIIFLIVPLALKRYRVPGIIGIIIVGALVGPNALHLLERDETIQLLGQVGLVYLMFIAGLEINLNQFIKNKDRSITYGLMSFVIPQGLGTVVGVYVLGFSWPAALLFASVFASHTLLAYPIVNRLDIVKNDAVTAAIGGTILTDTLALLVLAIVMAAHAGALTLSFWVVLTVGLTAFFVGVWIIVPLLGRWFFRNLTEESYFEFLFVMAVLFVCAYLAEVAGVEAIIGAFLAGLVLNRLIPTNGTLMNRIEFVGNALFIPFFLLSVGMLVDATVLLEGPRTLIVAASLIIMVVLTKWLAAQLTGVWYKYSKEEYMTMFGLSVGQAAAALAIVLIGYDAGLFTEHVLNATVLMILATAVIAPWVVETYGREVALAEARKPYEPSDQPQRILVPMANPATSDDLVDMALLLHSPKSTEPIYPMMVVPGWDNAEEDVARAEAQLNHAIEQGASAEVEARPLISIDPNVASGIARTVKENRITTIVAGWTGETSTRYIFGSVMDQLLGLTDKMVFVCKFEAPLNTARRVLVALPPQITYEPGFGAALRALKIMSHQLGAPLVIVTQEERSVDFEDIAERTPPEHPFEVRVVDRWTELLTELEQITQPHDIVALISVREGAIAWQRSLDYLPADIARSLRKTNFLVAYLSEDRANLRQPALIYTPEPQPNAGR